MATPQSTPESTVATKAPGTPLGSLQRAATDYRTDYRTPRSPPQQARNSNWLNAMCQTICGGPDDDMPFHDYRTSSGLWRSQVLDLVGREITPDDYELLLLLDESVVKPKADVLAIESLPQERASILALDDGQRSCTICLNAFAADDTVTLLGCGHPFHHECVTKWLKEQRQTCPLCNKQALDPLSPTDED